MTRPHRRPRLAVLIDGENIPADTAAQIFSEAEALGDIAVRRLYGDPTIPRMKKWLVQLTPFRLVHRISYGHAKGKNSSDIALCIDAMDLLHTSRLDGICIASSDSDFTHLALRVREHGLDIYGMGEAKRAEAYSEAFDRFIALEKPAAPRPKRKVAPAIPLAIQLPEMVVTMLEKAVDGVKGKSGWARVSAVENRLKQGRPSFSPADFGQDSLENLLKAAGIFEVDLTAGRAPRVKEKQGKSEKD
jgi:hypothetical protein